MVASVCIGEGEGPWKTFLEDFEKQSTKPTYFGPMNVPLDTLGISTEALDGLYETGTVRTPTGDVVDVTHVFAALDLKTAGATSKGAAAELLYDVRLGGVLTWVGDLAWWFVQWVERRSDLDATPSTEPVTEAGPSEETGGLSGGDLALMDELAKSKTSKDDLLGDMDATVMAEENVRPSTVEHVEAESRRIIYKNIDTELSMPVSQILEQYYSIGKGTAKPDESQQRFPNFVRKATPPIPHTTTGTGTVALAADAETAIYTAIGNVANLFMSRMSRGTSDDSDPLTKYDMILREMARRFTRFLGTGLAKGDAPWP